MKQQKFKAWHKREKQMSKPFTFFDIGDGRIRNVWSSPRLSFPINECIIRNSIGRKDSFNKEIFEGDYVIDLTHSNKGGAVYEIVRTKSGWIGRSNDGDKYGAYTMNLYINDENPKLKIIGNKYQNPDLFPRIK